MIMEFILRPWRIEDADSLVENANNINIAKYLTDMFPHPYTKENAANFINYANSDVPIHIFAIEVDNKAVGGIGIHPQNDIMRKNAELGYWLGEKYWNMGIISKAISLMVDFAFNNYDIVRLYARPFGNNIASQRVLEKNGFKLEARIEKNIFKYDEFLDELIYALRRSNI